MIASEFTVIDLVSYLKQGKTSVREFCDSLLTRVKVVDEEIHAFSELRYKYILDQAKELDKTKQDGEHIGKLFGVPFGISDNISTIDFFTEVGSKICKGQQFTKDSSVVQRLRNEDAIIFGKTNVTEFSDSCPTKTMNPHDKNFTPGGSASGAAASVASGMVPFSIASQTDGSIIRSASYCGVFGFKPSNNTIPNTGLVIKSITLDSIGFFSRSLEDIGYILEIVAGYDGQDEKTLSSSTRNYHKILNEDPPFDPKFLYAKTSALKKLSKPAQKAMQNLTKNLKKHISLVDLPDSVMALQDSHKIIYESELSFNLTMEYENYKQLLSPELKRKIRSGKKYTAHDYMKALKSREETKLVFLDFFEHFDAILTPSSIDSAPLLISKSTGDPCLSTIWSFCGLPMINLPLLRLDNNMPFGVQLVGAPNDDARLLRTARWLVKNFG